MATIATNNRVQDIGFEQKVPCKVLTDGTADINQGDNVYVDTTNHVVKVVGSDANAQFYRGVACDTSFRNLYGTKQYPDSGTLQVYVAGIFFFTTTSGDTYHDEDKIYIGADAQTVTNTVGGNTYEIGVAKLRPGSTSLAAATGVTVDIQIQPRWPVSSAL